jgi:hypothetical protein
MVLIAKGQPDGKSREMEGQMPFEEWIYGKAPQEVDFVRINGNRVIRVEVAKVGQTPVIFTKDEVEGLMRTDGTPLDSAISHTRTVAEGDVQRDPDKEAPDAPPSLRKAGEKLPTDDDKTDIMRPVQFPKPKTDQNGTQPASTQPAPTAAPAGTAIPGSSAPADGSQPATQATKPQPFLPSGIE